MTRPENDGNPDHRSPSTAGNPEDLHQLRTSVEDWLEKARDAVWSFKREDGSFQSDSKKSDHSSITTTARCYMALAYTERQLGKESERDKPEWRKTLASYMQDLPMKPTKSGFEVTKPDNEKKQELNNFEIAHLADFEFVRKFSTRFCTDVGSASTIEWPTKKVWKDKCVDEVLRNLLRNQVYGLKTKENSNDESQDIRICSEVPFDQGSDSSGHYFVTLHTLRALSTLGLESPLSREGLRELAENARRFCVEQCFYCQRGIRHLQDSARFVFASLIYCMYAEDVDREVMVAIVEAIASIQEPSGKWPASHPIVIVREQKKSVWYIASAELALCLTWLYFQPALPDAARRIVLEILERHFRNWIVPTYRRAPGKKNAAGESKEFYGWLDDSAMGQEKVVGWATAIVCHFLANYNAVLNDHINRAVVESLGLQSVAKRYLIDETASNRNPRWGVDAAKEKKEIRTSACPWPDLPPIAWSENVNQDELEKQIWRAWTDPEPGAALTRRLATSVLMPIHSVSRHRPEKMVAGILDGPPGTRKTSLVKAISETLQWPYVPVPASTIFDRGFDNMEARGSEVFRRLNYLTQCVVFFDEFEEFFRKRKKHPGSDEKSRFSPHDRTIAAFTTAAMLPRIQDLHDEKRSLIFLATNNFDEMDRAIVRAGRFDFKETIDHPTVARFKNMGGEKGFFIAPTDFTLKKLGLNRKKDTKTLKMIQKAIQGALTENKLGNELEDLQEALEQEALEQQSAEQQNMKKPDESKNKKKFTNLRIKFELVENAAIAVSELIKGGEENEKKLAKKVEEILKDEIKKAIALGPGPLPNDN